MRTGPLSAVHLNARASMDRTPRVRRGPADRQVRFPTWTPIETQRTLGRDCCSDAVLLRT